MVSVKILGHTVPILTTSNYNAWRTATFQALFIDGSWVPCIVIPLTLSNEATGVEEDEPSLLVAQAPITQELSAIDEADASEALLSIFADQPPAATAAAAPTLGESAPKTPEEILKGYSNLAVLEMRARNIIMSSSQEFAGSMLESANAKPFTAAELWLILRDYDISSRAARYAQATRQLSKLRAASGERIGALYDRLYSLRIELRDCGHPLKDEDFLAHVVSALPRRFKDLRSALRAVPATNISHKEHRRILVTAEAEMEDDDEEDEEEIDSGASLPVLQAKRQRVESGARGSFPRCNNCGAFGTHRAADCTSPPKDPKDWPKQPSPHFVRRVDRPAAPRRAPPRRRAPMHGGAYRAQHYGPGPGYYYGQPMSHGPRYSSHGQEWASSQVSDCCASGYCTGNGNMPPSGQKAILPAMQPR